MAANGWKLWEMAKKDGKCCNCIEMAKMAGNGWTWLEMAKNGLN